MSPELLIVIYSLLAIGASFLCSILEAVLLSTSRGHVAVLEAKGSRAAQLWVRYKEDPERPLTAILRKKNTKLFTMIYLLYLLTSSDIC